MPDRFCTGRPLVPPLIHFPGGLRDRSNSRTCILSATVLGAPWTHGLLVGHTSEFTSKRQMDPDRHKPAKSLWKNQLITRGGTWTSARNADVLQVNTSRSDCPSAMICAKVLPMSRRRPIAFSARILAIQTITGVQNRGKKCIRASASSTNRSRTGRRSGVWHDISCETPSEKSTASRLPYIASFQLSRRGERARRIHDEQHDLVEVDGPGAEHLHRRICTVPIHRLASIGMAHPVRRPLT